MRRTSERKREREREREKRDRSARHKQTYVMVVFWFGRSFNLKLTTRNAWPVDTLINSTAEMKYSVRRKTVNCKLQSEVAARVLSACSVLGPKLKSS